jgi:hypothetical protein
LREALVPELPPPPAEDFLSGTSGGVAGVRLTTEAVVKDALMDGLALARAERPRLRRAASRSARRRVLALAVERAGAPNLLREARTELGRSRHEVEFQVTDAGDRGKFENLRALLDAHPVDGFDWLLVLDDDVALPSGFLDAFLFLSEHFELSLAQPAHRRRSNAAWEVTRRRPLSVVRETAFVEIGPVFAFGSAAFDALLPFPPLRSGWSLELHWSAIAGERGLRQGVVDATPVTHRIRPIAASYDRGAAVEEARAFLSGRAYTPAEVAQRTLVTHRSWRR